MLCPLQTEEPLNYFTCRLAFLYSEVVNGFTDDGWSMLESDSIDDVTLHVNSSPSKMMGTNTCYNNGFPSMNSSVLCAKASMLLQFQREFAAAAETRMRFRRTWI